jgi:hypothetical protein
MYCPDCGSEAGEAKFCPECGADLSAVRGAVRGAKGGPKGGGKKAGATLGPQPRPEPSRGPSAALLWGGIAVVAAIVVVLVLVFSGDSADNTAATGDGGGGTGTTTPIEADTSGSYSELVDRANGLYDQGDALFKQNQIEQGAAYFAAAAKIYQAAWKKQPGDPNVGTDWATALFYSGDIEGAVKQIDVILTKDPEFQTGWFNKGNYLAHEARITEQTGDAKAAKKLYEEARQAYLRAVAIDPASDVGKEADKRLKDIPG